MTIGKYFDAARRSWQLIVATTLIVTSAAAAYTLLQTPQWQATASVYVSIPQATSVQDLSQGNTFTQQIVVSYADVVKTRAVLDPVISKLHLRTTPRELAKRISAEAPLDTVVLNISAVDPSRAQAERIADVASDELSAVAARLTPAAGGSEAAIKLTRVQPADAGLSPVSPKIGLNIAAGALAGLLLGYIVALARATLDSKIRNESDVRALMNSPILGTTTFSEKIRRDHLVLAVNSDSASAESYKRLQTNLRFASVDGAKKAITFTSSIESEGKSTTATNTAIAAAAAGQRVLLVDGDLRRPKIAQYLGLDDTAGLTNILIGEISISAAVQSWGGDGLSVLTSGTVPPNPVEILQSPRMAALLHEFRENYDLVVIDAPPLLPVADATVLAHASDGVILIVSAGHATQGQVKHAVTALQQASARMVGTVVTMLPSKGPNAYSYRNYSYTQETE